MFINEIGKLFQNQITIFHIRLMDELSEIQIVIYVFRNIVVIINTKRSFIDKIPYG